MRATETNPSAHVWGEGGDGGMKKRKKNSHPLMFEVRVGGWGTRNLCLALHECQLSTRKARDT